MSKTAEKTDPKLWEKDPDNHLAQWTKEEWGTKSGQESEKTGERYLPKKAREKMSDAEYKKTSDKKRADTKKGKQHSAQPEGAAQTTKEARLEAMTLKELRERASSAKIDGRSKMKKAELVQALERA